MYALTNEMWLCHHTTAILKQGYISPRIHGQALHGDVTIALAQLLCDLSGDFQGNSKSFGVAGNEESVS